MCIHTHANTCSCIISICLYVSVYPFPMPHAGSSAELGLFIYPSPADRLAVSGTERRMGRDTDGRSERGGKEEQMERREEWV